MRDIVRGNDSSAICANAFPSCCGRQVAASPAFGSASHLHESENPAAEESLSQPRERTKKKKKAARTGLED